MLSFFIILSCQEKRNHGLKLKHVVTPCFSAQIPTEYEIIEFNSIDSYSAGLYYTSTPNKEILHIECGFGAYSLEDDKYSFVRKCYLVRSSMRFFSSIGIEPTEDNINKVEVKAIRKLAHSNGEYLTNVQFSYLNHSFEEFVYIPKSIFMYNRRYFKFQGYSGHYTTKATTDSSFYFGVSFEECYRKDCKRLTIYSRSFNFMKLSNFIKYFYSLKLCF